MLWKSTHLDVLIGMYFDAFGAERQQALFARAEVRYFLGGVEGACSVDRYLPEVVIVGLT